MEKLTQDLIIDILSRFPTVPLLRSRCVCKSWHHIITSDAIFTTLRNNHQCLLTNADALILISPSHFTDKTVDQLYFTHFDENVGPLIQKIAVSSFIHGITKEVFLRVVGVCNGLICLATFQKPLHGLSAPIDKQRIKSFHILNPISRENIELPKFEEESLLSTSDGVTGKISKRRYYGFGFDKCNQVFKLVLFLVFDDVDDDEYGNNNNHVVMTEMFVFTFGSGWRKSLGEVPSMIRYAFSDTSNICVNGCLYWITCTTVPDSTSYSLVIMSFNLGDETFGIIEPPEMIVIESAYYLVQARYYYTLSVFDNCLCWIDMKNDKHINIWIKKSDSDSDKSWIKKFCLQKNLLPGQYGPVRPIKLEQNGELFLYHRNHAISYNVRCNTSKFFIIDEELEGISHDEGFPFAVSLGVWHCLLKPVPGTYEKLMGVDSVVNWFHEWPKGCAQEWGAKVWSLLPYATVWSIWKARNSKTFRNKEVKVDRLCKEIKATIWYWCANWRERRRFKFVDLLERWDRVIQGEIRPM